MGISKRDVADSTPLTLRPPPFELGPLIGGDKERYVLQ